jgi:hypothetical protein
LEFYSARSHFVTDRHTVLEFYSSRSHFVTDRHTVLEFYSARSMEQQSAGRQVHLQLHSETLS